MPNRAFMSAVLAAAASAGLEDAIYDARPIQKAPAEFEQWWRGAGDGRQNLAKSPLCADLSDGRLDHLASVGAPYTAAEVAAVACNMAANILPNGTILASPAQGKKAIYTFPNGSAYLQNNYYAMWQRDAGLTMRTLLRVAKEAPAVRRQLEVYVKMYLDQIWLTAESPNRNCAPWGNATGGFCSAYGEPKFGVDASVYRQPWGRNQNDGPALNVLVMIELLALKDVEPALLRAAKAKIVEVMNYVGNVGLDSTVDPWEMLYGQHFFVQAVQRRAMTAAAELAKKGSLTGEVWNFEEWTHMLESLLEVHWSPQDKVVVETVARVPSGSVGPKCFSSGLDPQQWTRAARYPPCELDTAVLIGSLSSKAAPGSPYPEVMPPHDSRILATAELLVESMGATYEVNRLDDAAGLPGVLIGRYPGDEYSGIIMSDDGFQSPCQGASSNCANPWFLTTHALAEVLYEAALAAAQGTLKVDAINARLLLRAVELGRPASERGRAVALPGGGRPLAELLLRAGDGVLKRAKHHALPGMHMSEQIYRGDGKFPPVRPGAQFGVRDLTWSYASLLDALAGRFAAVEALTRR